MRLFTQPAMKKRRSKEQGYFAKPHHRNGVSTAAKMFLKGLAASALNAGPFSKVNSSSFSGGVIKHELARSRNAGRTGAHRRIEGTQAGCKRRDQADLRAVPEAGGARQTKSERENIWKTRAGNGGMTGLVLNLTLGQNRRFQPFFSYSSGKFPTQSLAIEGGRKTQQEQSND